LRHRDCPGWRVGYLFYQKRGKSKEAAAAVESILSLKPEPVRPEDAIEGLVAFNVFVRDQIHLVSDEL
jgi:hypothetical protein